MTDDKVDLSAIPADGELSRIAQLGQELYAAEEAVLVAQAALKRAERQRDLIAEVEIPEVMEDLGIEQLKLKNGAVIEVKEHVSVRPKAENRPLVIQALEEEGKGNLVKTTIVVPFNRNEDREVAALLHHINTAMRRTAKQERKVEPATLRAHVIKKLRAGEAVDVDLFGVTQVKKAHFADGAPEEPVFDGERTES